MLQPLGPVAVFSSSNFPFAFSTAGGDTASLAETFDTKDVGTGKHLKPAAVVSDGNGGGNYAVALEDNPTGTRWKKK